jgi:hypothetical protein
MIPAGNNSFRLRPISSNGQSAAQTRARTRHMPGSAA